MFLDLTGRPVVVVGAGRVAERKTETLISYGAQVTVIGPEATSRIQDLAASGQITWHDRPYRKGDLRGTWLVIASTDRDEINRLVVEEAKELGLLFNVVDDPENCNFIVPAVVRRGKLQIAVSTSGASPALAKRIRQRLEETFTEEYGCLVDVLGELRPLVLKKIQDPQLRKEFFESLIDSDLLTLCRDGRQQEALEMAKQELREVAREEGVVS